MSKHDCYVVDGCVDFIPVKRSALTQNGVEVTIVGSAQKERVLVDKVYQMSKISEPQKPVIPQFVAEWIEKCKASRRSLRDSMKSVSTRPDVNEWLLMNGREMFTYPNQETFARAWLDGYEVEKEPLYTVRIPNPNRISFLYALYRKNDGKIIIIGASDNCEEKEEYQLTEAEIKQDFEWAWKWAEPVKCLSEELGSIRGLYEEKRIEDKEKAEQLIDSYKYAIELLKEVEVE